MKALISNYVRPYSEDIESLIIVPKTKYELNANGNYEAEKNPEEEETKKLPDTANRIFYGAEIEDQKKTPDGINYMKKEGNKQVRKTSTPKS